MLSAVVWHVHLLLVHAARHDHDTAKNDFCKHCTVHAVLYPFTAQLVLCKLYFMQHVTALSEVYSACDGGSQAGLHSE